MDSRNEVYAMKIPEAMRMGKRPPLFYENTYHTGRVPVKNGLLIFNDWRVKTYFHSIGYVDVDIDLVCQKCYMLFETKEEKEKHDKEVHKKNKQTKKQSKVKEEMKPDGKSDNSIRIEDEIKNIYK